MYLKKIKFTLILLFTITGSLWSQNNKITPMEVILADEPAIILGKTKITVASAVRDALKANHDLMTGTYDMAMADSDYQRYRSKYSPIFQAEGGITHTKNPELYWSEEPKETQSNDLSASISKYFQSGTTISGGYSQTTSRHEWDNNVSPESTYSPSVFASIQQEFMKNAFGYNDRRELKILKNNAKMQKNNVAFNLSVVVVGVIIDYWDTVIRRIHLSNSELMLRETKRVRNIVAGNVKLGLSERFLLNYWNALVVNSEANLDSARQEYKNSLRNLLQELNYPAGYIQTGKPVLSNKLIELDEEKILKVAFEKRVDYNNAVMNLKNARHNLEIQNNNALPSLTGNVSVTSRDYNGDSGEAYGNTGSFDKPIIDARITMTYPLNDTQQKVNERNAKWQIKQAELQLKKHKRSVKDEIRTRIETIRTNYKLYKKASKARVQAEIYYTRLLRSLRRGRFTASDVRDALDGLINSREAELRNLVMYNISLFELKVAKNAVFDDYKIDITKFMPKK